MKIDKRPFVVTDYTLAMDCVNSPLRICVLSDLHGNLYGEKNSSIITKINQLKPDAIMVPGDMVTRRDKKSLLISLQLLLELGKKYTIFYSLGNHEMHQRYNNKAFGKYINLLKQGNIHVLDNKKVIWKVKGEEINIYGLTLPYGYFKKSLTLNLDYRVIKDLLGEASGNNNILLAHTPRYFKAYEKWGANLVLSGHYHGGLIGIGKRGILAPDLTPLPLYCSGVHKSKKCSMIVSRGIGDHKLTFRLNNPKEVLDINIIQKD